MKPVKLPSKKPSWSKRKWRALRRFFRQARKRWSEESPSFFVGLQKFGLFLAGVPSAILTIQSLEGFPLRLVEWAKIVSFCCAAAGVAIATVCGLTAKNPPKDDGIA